MFYPQEGSELFIAQQCESSVCFTNVMCKYSSVICSDGKGQHAGTLWLSPSLHRAIYDAHTLASAGTLLVGFLGTVSFYYSYLQAVIDTFIISEV